METTALRTALQLGIYKVINPFVRLLIKMGLTPNAVTVIGLALNIGVAVVFIAGGEEGNRSDLRFVGWAGALILFAGLFDMLDGQVARLGNMKTEYGALFDSVLDRYSELFMFLGICYYLIAHHYFLSSLLAFIGLIGSMMVSYTRARAEGLGIESKGGLMQRPERVVLLGLSAVACGIGSAFLGGNYKLFAFGLPFHVFETMSIFTFPIAVLAVLTNVTAISRLLAAKKALENRSLQAAPNASAGKKGAAVAALTVAGGLVFLTQAVAQPAAARPNFPVPTGVANQLFYLQRDPNANTIVGQLNLNEAGRLNEKEPVHVFWLRYAEQGQRKELSFIQRKFAYGLRATRQGPDSYELRFVSTDKLRLYLMKASPDNAYHVYATIANKQAVLERIFVRIDGGTLWMPDVKYVELTGRDALTRAHLTERRAL